MAGSLNAIATPILGAATTTNQVSGDPAYSEYEIAECILAAEYELAKAICSANSHGRKMLYLATPVTTTTSPYTVPSHLGEIVDVQIKYTNTDSFVPAEPSSAVSVARLAQGINPLGLTLYKGLYSITNNILWFTGYQAQVRFCEFNKPTSPTDAASLVTLLNTLANTPDEYWMTTAILALAKIMPKEGSLLQGGAYYTQLAQAELQSIVDGKPPITNLQLFQFQDK